MKTMVNLLGLLSLSFLLLTCQDEEEEAIKAGQIQFQLDQFLDPNSSGRIASALPAGSSLLISVNDDSGNPVLTFERIEILTLGTSSVSAPVRLSPGSYTLVDFLVVNESNEVLYATPKAGSTLARLVSRPLPFSFSVWKERVTNVTTQVVRAEESTAEDFGYASFHIDIAAFPEFRLAVLAPVHGNMTLVDADVSLVHGTETIYSKHLPGLRINEIIFEGDQSESYTLIVKKDGYKVSSQTFVLSELRAALQGDPLEVVLTPALTFEIVYGGGEYSMTTTVNFEMNGVDGKEVVIDWGDGSVDSVVLTPADYWNASTTLHYHTYQNAADFSTSQAYITVTGDIEDIQLLRFGWDMALTSIALQHVPGLIHLGVNFQGPLHAIDVSENHALQILIASYSNQLNTITLGDNPELLRVHLAELPLTTSAIDDVITKLYTSVQNHPRFGGIFELYNYNSDFVFIGPPSAASMDKLRSLGTYYGWEIAPSPW